MQKLFTQTKAFSRRILKALEKYGRRSLGVITLCSLLASSPVFAGIPLKQGDGIVNENQINAAIEVYNRIPASIRLQYELNHNSITFFSSRQRRRQCNRNVHRFRRIRSKHYAFRPGTFRRLCFSS